MDELLHRLHAQSTIGDLPAHELALELSARGEVLAGLFQRHPGLPGVVVTEGGEVRGVLSRGQYLRLVSRYLGHEVYHPRPIRHMFEAVEQLELPLVLDAATPVQEAVALAVQRPRALLYEPLIVRGGFSLKLVDFPDLLLADSRISALRNQQMRQILATVQEGFLLVDRDETVAAEYSDWVRGLFGRVPIAGRRFSELLLALFGGERAALGRDYLLTLFDPNVMERWVADINPLKQAESRLSGAPRHLAFRFVRCLQGGAIDRILVQITDRTREVELARELEAQESKARERVDLVFALLQIDAGALAAFLASFDRALALATRQLAPAAGAPSFALRLREIARAMHAVKGEAGLLGLAMLAKELHAFEDLLGASGGAAEAEKERLPGLLAGLGELARGAGEIRATLEQLGKLGRLAPPVPAPAPAKPAATPSRLAALSRHVEELAGKLGKEARFVSQVAENEIPAVYRPLVDKALVQLARNSLVHGVETPEERRRAGKAPGGTLQLALRRHPAERRLELVFQDDGRGLDLDKIRRRAQELGLTGPGRPAASAAELSGLIFRSGFSTAGEQTLEAGRGVGLDLVRAEVEQYGGSILAHSQPGAFCAFQILLPDVAPAASSGEKGAGAP